MPLIFHSAVSSSAKIGVWHITEAEDFFLQKISIKNNISHPRKRLQHLAGRYLLTELFPDFPTELIQIADTKKPYIENEPFHFSISHCGAYAAVIVSTANRVGVDIETPHPKIERIKDKFLTENEQLFINNNEQITMAWSIKEAIFKWYGLGGVDFKKHIKINAFQKEENTLIANCTFCKAENVFLEVVNIMVEGNNLSWIMS